LLTNGWIPKMLELFNRVNKGPWTTVGDDLQYRVEDNILFFQCSKSERDWRNNFDFPAEPYRDCGWKVHRGFKRVWKSGMDTILPILLSLSDPVIVGYSHGGPLAMMAHEAYWWETQKQPRTTVFGSPRFLYDVHPDILFRWSKVINCQVRGDLVTCLPPWYIAPGHRYQVGPRRLPWPTNHTPEAYRRYL
jgi:hypothetical protein